VAKGLHAPLHSPQRLLLLLPQAWAGTP